MNPNAKKLHASQLAWEAFFIVADGESFSGHH
jgi:hypothetical protein